MKMMIIEFKKEGTFLIEKLRKQNEKQLEMSKKSRNQKEREKQEIIGEILKQEDCFFQIPIEYAYAILEDLGYLPEEQKEIYRKLVGIEAYQKLIKKKK